MTRPILVLLLLAVLVADGAWAEAAIIVGIVALLLAALSWERS